MKIAVINYGMGNLHSVYRKLKLLNADAKITNDPSTILSSDKLVLPGVGHFQKAMQNLSQLNLIDVLNEFAHVKKKPVLGICLGMQLMATQSEEGNSKGLGWFEANVVRFNVSNNLLFKIPHTGWNQTNIKKPSAITSGINNLSEFYFVHSYHWQSQRANDVLCETIYDYTFTSGVEKENIFGVQFHPEKSHDAGQQMLKNFIQL